MLPHTAALRRRCAQGLPFLALVLLAFAPASRAEPVDDRWEAYVGTLPHVETDLACVLVRDGRSGMPLEWALVSSHGDWAGSDGWGPLAVADRTDEYGLVRLRPIEGAPLWVVKTPGLGPGERFGLGAFQHTFDLWPAPEVHGRIVDVRGRPVAGAQVEWTSEESRHGPSLGLAVTDANGLWRMRVPAEGSAVTLVSGPGIRQTWSLSHAPSWAAAPIAVALPGRDVEGRIVGRSGAMGHLMVSSDTVRGPCGSIDADGRFRVPSCNPNCSTVYLHGYTPPPEGELPWLVDRSPELAPTSWTPGRFIVWDPDADPASDVGRVRDVVLRVEIEEGQTEEEETGALILLDRREDGRRFSHWVFGPESSDNQALHLAPGTYDVRTPPFGEWAASPTVLVVAAEGAAPALDVTLQRQPRLLIDPPLEVACIGWAFAGTPFGDEAEDLDAGHGTRTAPALHVPATGDVGITVQGPFGTATALAQPTENGMRRVQLQLPQPAVVSVPAGILDLDLLWFSRSHMWMDGKHMGDRAEIRLPPGGRVWLDAASFDRESDEGGGCALEIPPQPGGRAEYDRDTVLGPAGASLRIRIPDDAKGLQEPVIDIWTPRFVRSDLDQPERTSVVGEPTPSGTLAATSQALCDGAWVALNLEAASEPRDAMAAEPRVERWLPVRWPCHGPGPYEFEVPRASVDLHLEAPEGARVALLIDGDLLALGEAPASKTLVRRVRGLAPGAHVAIVAATGCESRLLRFATESGEQRKLEVALRPR